MRFDKWKYYLRNVSDPAVINTIGNGPTKEYYDEYSRLNRLLDHLDIKAAEIIKEYGFNAFPITRANVTAIILKAVEDRKIVGSVRAFEQEGTSYIGRLIVHPDYQNKGIGKKLMDAIEKCFEGVRYELFTGHLSEKNLLFYEKLGYRMFKTEKVTDNLRFVYMEKKVGGFRNE